MATELEEVIEKTRYSRVTILLTTLQLVEFLHHGNTEIRQIGTSALLWIHDWT